MKNILDLLSDIVIIFFFQAAVLIPLTILGFFVRQMVIREIRKIRYRQKQKIFEKYQMDLSQIPESLHGLVPYAKEFGISDSQERMKHQEEVSFDQKRAFARSVRGHEDDILQWLKVLYPDYPKEACAFAYMLKSLEEMNLVIDDQTYSVSGVEVYTNIRSVSITKRIIYYQPRPKNGIEKLIYDFFSAIIMVIIFPVFYYLMIQAWSVFSPHEESVAAFGLICILSALLSRSTFQVAGWAIKRAWKQYVYR